MATVSTATPSKPKEIDWTKPQAMAIPKEGYFEIEKRTVTDPYIPRLRPATGFQSSQRSSLAGSRRSATTGRVLRMR